MVVKVGHQRQWFAEVDIALAKVAQLAQATHHLRQALFLFGGAAQLFSVGAYFHHVFIADVDRHQSDRPGAAAQHRLDGHRQRTGLRIEQTAGTGAAAFDEILDGIAAAEQLAKIFTEHRGVELVALKGATDEERAQAAEDRPGRPEVEVDARRDMRWHQALMIQDVGEQQIVHVAAVAGDIDNLMAVVRQLAYALGVMHVDALVQAVPGEAENAVGQADHLVREVRGNLFHQRDSVLLSLLMRNFLAARFVFHRAGNRFRGQQFIKQILAGRQTRADGGQALAGKVHPGDASQLLGDDLIGTVLIRHAAQRHGRRETHETVAAEPGDGEKFLDTVQHPQRRIDFPFLTTRRAAEHHRDRHHLHIEVRMVAVQIEVVVEQLDGLFFWRVIGEYARPAVDEYVARQQGAVDFQRF